MLFIEKNYDEIIRRCYIDKNGILVIQHQCLKQGTMTLIHPYCLQPFSINFDDAIDDY
jgi:hypothetical protein